MTRITNEDDIGERGGLASALGCLKQIKTTARYAHSQDVF